MVTGDNHEGRGEETLDQIRHRRAKLDELRARGVEPYPARAHYVHEIAGVLNDFSALEATEAEVNLCGRVRGLRSHGKVTFADLVDGTGKIQLFLKHDILGDNLYGLVKLLDLGDFLQVVGKPMTTRTGQPSLRVLRLKLLSKALRPLPVVKEEVDEEGNVVRHDALADVETRYRQRYLDLLLNPKSRERFAQRSRLLRLMRDFLDERGFLEVETPILQPLYGGAAAAPFTTHHNKLDTTLYLRIADELYLKRLVVGGLHRVYEIGKDFRNEGLDRTHNPEFTQCELYAAYWDYTNMMGLFESLMGHLAFELTGDEVVEYQGRSLDFGKPFKRLPVLEGIRQAAGVDLGLDPAGELDRAAALEICASYGWEFPEHTPTGKIVMTAFEELAEEHGLLEEPVFVVDYPADISPLAKRKPEDPRLVERFEPHAAGLELGNAFTEQNDPDIQRAVLEAQAAQRELGDEEANVVDEDFLRALEYGMPPTAGLGIGVDRLAMLLTDAPSIQDVLLFPQMRPRS